MSSVSGRRAMVMVAAVIGTVGALVPASARAAETYVPISAAGSTWASNAVSQWSRNLQQEGRTINYQPSGSVDGRRQFENLTVDFAVADYPYGTTESAPAPARGFASVPFLAGAIGLEYNLRVGGRRVENLRLSGEVVAAIFTGTMTNWDDPAIAVDNPGLVLPDLKITPVVRADDTGSSLQFTGWLASVAPDQWQAHCERSGVTPCRATSQFPPAPGMSAESGALGVCGYVAESAGAITYVENSYPLNLRMPVAQVLNRSGFYTAPTPAAVGIALLQANTQIDPSTSDYPGSVLSGTYNATDPRAYPLSYFGYLVVPTAIKGSFTPAKAVALVGFGQYATCRGQEQANALGYAALPVNLAQAGLNQLAKIPGANPTTLTLADCEGATFGPDGADRLTSTAPSPPACDQVGQPVCGTDSTPPDPDPEPDPASNDSETISVTVEPGTLTITAGGGDVDLGRAAVTPDNSGIATASVDLNPVTVTDTRTGDTGYSVTGTIGDFTSGSGGRIGSGCLGWRPRIIAQEPGQALVAGPSVAPEASPFTSNCRDPRTARTLASALSGAGAGTAVLTAAMQLRAPTSTPAGDYRSTLTLTVI